METIAFYADYEAFQRFYSAFGATNGWYVSAGAQMFGRETFSIVCPTASREEVLRAVSLTIPGTEVVQ